MAFPNTSLTTPGQAMEKRLLAQEGVDLLQPGGFAQRDAIRQAVSEREQGAKRMSRAANLAYRQAVRQGDRRGALDILMKTSDAGIDFGGVRAAGRGREQAITQMGEEAATARDIEARNMLMPPQQDQGVVEENAIVETAEPGSDLLLQRQQFAEELKQAKASGDIDPEAMQARAKSREAASSYWQKLGNKRTPKDMVDDMKLVQETEKRMKTDGDLIREREMKRMEARRRAPEFLLQPSTEV